MLSQADEDLCARDPALPGLAAVLDTDALVRRAGLGDLRPTYLRYKPGTSCVVGLTSANGVLRAFAAMTYPPARYAEVRTRKEWQSGTDPVRYFDDICTALVPLSRDRRLKAARALGHPERRDAYLQRLGLDRTTLALLRYKPGRRLVMRADTTSGMRAVIKAHGKRDFAAAAAGARHAARAAGVPLLGIAERRRTIVSQWIPGDVLSPARSDLEAFRGVGAELARLHRATPCPGAPVEVANSLGDADALAALLPDLAEPAGAAASAIARYLAQLDPAACMVHGDFSADQVILRDGQPTVIDWDRMGAGDPARDLGSFLARLDADQIEGSISTGAADAAEHALLYGYARASGGLPAGIDLHRAMALLALTPEGFRRRRSEWRAEAEAVLARVEALIDRPSSAPRGATPGLADALDPPKMASRLAAALGDGLSAPPEIRLLRHKEGRRALLCYDLPGRPAMLGKLRAKGPDRRTPGLHRALRGAGLDGRAPDGVGVPEPLGEIDELALWLQRVVPGRPLTAFLTSGAATDAARLAGRALAILHGSGVAAERTWSMADELTVLDRALTDAADANRALMPSIGQIRRAAHDSLRALAAVEMTGIHRDFYPDQVLVDGNAVWLVDLDLYAEGDPLVDVGNFLAHLTELGVRLNGDPMRFRSEGAAFLAGYAERRGLADRRRLGVLHWVSLARHIGISGRIAGRGHTTEQLVSICAGGPRPCSMIIDTGPSRMPAA